MDNRTGSSAQEGKEEQPKSRKYWTMIKPKPHLMMFVSFWQDGCSLAGCAISQRSPKGAVNQTTLCWICVCVPRFSWVNSEFIAKGSTVGSNAWTLCRTSCLWVGTDGKPKPRAGPCDLRPPVQMAEESGQRVAGSHRHLRTKTEHQDVQ